MVWIRLCLTCILTMGFAGSIASLGSKLVQRIGKLQNPYYLLMWEKVSIILYWLPIPFVIVYLIRLDFQNNMVTYIGEFACSSVTSMTNVFNTLGIIWLVGFLASVIRSIYRQYGLVRICQGNVKVDKKKYLDIFQEYQVTYGLLNVEIYQNDLLTSPITYTNKKKRIVLPFVDYSEKQIRMIFEHEINHIYRNDLWWRKVALFTSWIHWFNPIIHQQLKQLIYMEEEVCDEEAGKGKVWYSQKEYASFLATLTDNGISCISTMALCESKNETVRRLEAMIRNRGIKKPEKWAIFVSCMVLVVFSLIPTGFVSAKTADFQEDWIRAEEVEVEAEPQNLADKSIEEKSVDDYSVKEISLSSEIEPYSSTIILDKTISANTRVVYQYKNMGAGSKISITAECDDSSVTYRIGIKNEATGSMTSISGSGYLSHTFEIPLDGRYSAYVENSSSKTITVSGVAYYSD